jgi:hypothetical protein
VSDFGQMRPFHSEKQRIPKTEDWVAERGGFESTRPLRIEGRNLARVWPTIQPDSKPSVLKRRTFFTKEFESSLYLSALPRHPECAEIQRTRTSHGCSSNPRAGSRQRLSDLLKCRSKMPMAILPRRTKFKRGKSGGCLVNPATICTSQG